MTPYLTFHSGFLKILLSSAVIVTLSACAKPLVTIPNSTQIPTAEYTKISFTLTFVLPTLTPSLSPEPTITTEPSTEPTTHIVETTPASTPETSALAPELTSQELAAKGFVGSGFELKNNYQGLPVDLTVVTSKASLAQYNQTRGCMPNQEMVKYGESAEDRMAEMVFLGHYVGYLRYSGNTETGYPFTKYIADLKAGANRSYSIWGPRLDGTDGVFTVNPLKPVEYVTTNAEVDPDGNGRGTARLTDNDSLGYQQLASGGLRIVQEMSFSYKDFLTFCNYSTDNFRNSLLSLGANIDDLKGGWQMTADISKFSITNDELDKLFADLKIYHDFNGSVGSAILAP